MDKYACTRNNRVNLTSCYRNMGSFSMFLVVTLCAYNIPKCYKPFVYVYTCTNQKKLIKDHYENHKLRIYLYYIQCSKSDETHPKQMVHNHGNSTAKALDTGRNKPKSPDVNIDAL